MKNGRGDSVCDKTQNLLCVFFKIFSQDSTALVWTKPQLVQSCTNCAEHQSLMSAVLSFILMIVSAGFS